MVETSYETYRFARFCLCPSRHALYLGGEEVPLTPKSFEVLLYLARHPGRVVTKEELLKAVWCDAYIEEGNLAQQVFRLRKAFEIEPGSASLIRTVSGRGYQFTAEVSRGALATAPLEPQYSEESSRQSTSTDIPGYSFERWRERTHVVVEEYTPAQTALSAPTHITAGGVALGALIATLVAGAIAGVIQWRNAHPALAPHHEIVLADFENRAGDSSFDFVLRNAVAIDLQQSPELTVLPAARVNDILKEMERPGGEPFSRALALEVCARNGDNAVLTGSISRLERNYVIALDATDCRSGTVFAALQSKAADKDAVLEAIGDLDSRMRAKLGESLRSIKGFDVPLQQATTSSFEALVAYSRGMTLPDAQAINFYQHAIQLDPDFALAWRKLGVSYENMGDVPAAKRAYARAYQLRGPTSSLEQFSITSHYVEYVEEDMEEGTREYRSWIRSYPDSGLAWVLMANGQNLLGLYDQAIESSSHAGGPQPIWFYYFDLASAYLRSSQFGAAESVCRAGISAFPDNEILHRILQEIVYDTHDDTDYQRQIEWAKGTGTEYQTLDQEAREAAAKGHLKAARALFDQARAETQRAKVPGYLSVINADQALYEALLGESQSAKSRAAQVPIDLEEPSFNAALGAALAGDLAYAQRVADATNRIAPPSSTLARKVELPILRAALELRKDHPDRAVEAIAPARQYQLRNNNFPYLLGITYLQAHQPIAAAAEFQKILDNRGVDGSNPMLPLAHLGLARANLMQGKTVDSRAQYEQLFATWQTADPNLPILEQARTEYAQLPR